MSMYCWCWGCCFGADRDCSHHMMVRDEMSHFHLRQPHRHQREGVVCAMQKTLPKGWYRGLLNQRGFGLIALDIAIQCSCIQRIVVGKCI